VPCESSKAGRFHDRINLHVNLRPINTSELRYQQPAESSVAMSERVIAAREIENGSKEAENCTNAKINRTQFVE
jgi:predicted ATPase with chaperone activity